MRSVIGAALAFALAGAACGTHRKAIDPGGFPSGFASAGDFGERVRVLDLYPGVTATLVAPAGLDARQQLDLILYALPNGNSTAQTIGRRLAPGVDWHYDIQHIGAQTRALREQGLPQAVVVYLETDRKSWPEWRRRLGYPRAGSRIVDIVDQLRALTGNPPRVSVTLTGHSGGGSFAWGFIDGQESLPDWLDRIAFLDSNYSFEARHGEKITRWLGRDTSNTLVVLAYDDREIMLDGRKVVSDSGGTWRASERMIAHFDSSLSLTQDTLGEFVRHRSAQVEILLHPNPANRILHTELIGEMNGYMHAMLVRRHGYGTSGALLQRSRAYERWIEDDVELPAGGPPDVPPKAAGALTGSAFIASIAALSRREREVAIRRELLAGNIPSFLRRLQRVDVAGAGPDGVRHRLSYEVMPDYLAIGSDEDFARMPMTPYTAQAFCDAFGFVLPTRKMVDDVWAAAPVKLEPWPLTEARESPLTFLEHDRIIAKQLEGTKPGTLVAGIKKDVVVSNKLLERAQRVAIFGWHRRTGEPIQPLYAGHIDWYVDYSHGVRPVRRSMRVDGAAKTFEAILGDAGTSYLLSDEGEIKVARYDK